MEQDLFSRAAKDDLGLSPLADRMRPVTINDVAGQEHLLADGRFLRLAIEADNVPSLIFWGPPGVGKTTIARVIAATTGSEFVSYSAVGGSVKEVRVIIEKAALKRQDYRKRTILFIDEIHRFNRSQQDTLLPGVEKGIITLIGATTENPSFQVNPALLSRCKVLELKPLDEADIISILKRAVLNTRKGIGLLKIDVGDDVLSFIAANSRGDARYALSSLELCVHHVKQKDGREVTLNDLKDISSAKSLLYDKSGEEHYNVVSAFIKSMRGSNPDGALYWMFRMLEAGEDPLFILRRMIIFASEDIGNADPRALQLAMSADAAFSRLGMPEGAYPMAQACTYLSSAPKSNAQVFAIKGPKADIKRWGALPVPKKLRNAPTDLMKQMGYSEGYRYPPDEGGFVPKETYLPGQLQGVRYYKPVNSGLEESIARKLERLRKEN